MKDRNSMCFPCPDCQKNLRVPAATAGKRTTCPNCGKVFNAPLVAELAAPPLAPDRATSLLPWLVGGGAVFVVVLGLAIWLLVSAWKNAASPVPTQVVEGPGHPAPAAEPTPAPAAPVQPKPKIDSKPSPIPSGPKGKEKVGDPIDPPTPETLERTSTPTDPVKPTPAEPMKPAPLPPTPPTDVRKSEDLFPRKIEEPPGKMAPPMDLTNDEKKLLGTWQYAGARGESMKLVFRSDRTSEATMWVFNRVFDQDEGDWSYRNGVLEFPGIGGIGGQRIIWRGTTQFWYRDLDGVVYTFRRTVAPPLVQKKIPKPAPEQPPAVANDKDPEVLAATKLSGARIAFDNELYRQARNGCEYVRLHYPKTKAAMEAKELLKQIEARELLKKNK